MRTDKIFDHPTAAYNRKRIHGYLLIDVNILLYIWYRLLMP